MKRNFTPDSSDANEFHPLSVEHPSINSIYQTIDSDKTQPQPNQLPIASSQREVQRNPPKPKLNAQPSFTTDRSDQLQPKLPEKRIKPHYPPRFTALAVAPTVQPTTVEVCFTGINLSSACKMFNLMDPAYHLNPMKPVIGTNIAISRIVPGHKLKMWICTEQVRANGIIRPYFRKNSVVVCHFDLNCSRASEISSDICESRMNFCTDDAMRVCMIGMRNQDRINDDALDIFERFQHKYNIEDVLIFDQSQHGQAALTEFFGSVIYKLNNSQEADNKLIPSFSNIIR